MKFDRQTGLIVGGVVVVVILVVIGVVRSSRQSVPVQALASLRAAESLAAEAELVFHLPPFLNGQQRPFTQITIDIEGDVRQTEGGTPEVTGDFHIEATGQGNTFFADGEARILQDRVLFYLNTLPVFLNPSGSLVERWTEVDAQLLTTANPAEVEAALAVIFEKLERADREDGLVRYQGELTAEEEQALAGVLRLPVSYNQGWQVIARLLTGNDVKLLQVWIDESKREVRRVQVDFVRQGFDFAELTLNFDDYGKSVEIDAPEHELTVDPEVFGEVFGGSQSLDTIDLDN